MSTTRKFRRLRRLKLDRIDLVDAGANPGAHISLFKREGVRSEVSETSDGVTTVPSVATKTKEAPPVDETAEETPDAPVEETPAEKPETSKDFAASALRKELQERDEELAELRKEKRMRHFIEKAGDFSTVAEPERLGLLLEEAERVLSDDNQEYLTKILKAAKSASEVESTSKIFEQLSQTEVEDEPWDQKLEKRAKEVADSQGITIEQAKAKVMTEDPELRAEYQKSRKETS